MAGRLDHVVGPADEPVVAVTVAAHQIATEVPAANETFAVAFVLVQVAAHHGRPRRLQGQLAVGVRRVDEGQLAVGPAPHHGGQDARQRLAHGAGLDVHRRVVRHHDPAGLGLPPVVVERHAESLQPPDHGFGVERFAHTGHEAQRRQVASLQRVGAQLHHHAGGRGRGVPDAHPFLLQHAVPGLRVELGLDHHIGHAADQWCDQAVVGAGHPARVGGAPEHILLVQVERVACGHQVGEHRLVHMHRPLGPTGGAAGEVQQAHGLGLRGADGVVRRPAGQQRVPRVHAGLGQQRRIGLAHQHHMPQAGQAFAQRTHLALVQLGCGDQHACIAHFGPRGNRLRSESRKQGRDHAARLERAEHRHVQLGQPAHEHKDALARQQAQVLQRMGKAAGFGGEVGVAQLAPLAALADPADGGAAAAAVQQVPVHRLVGDVQAPATGQAVELAARVIPAEGRDRGLVIGQVGRHGRTVARLADDVHQHLRAGVAGRCCASRPALAVWRSRNLVSWPMWRYRPRPAGAV